MKIRPAHLGLALLGIILPLVFHARAEDAYRLPQLFALSLAVFLLASTWSAGLRFGAAEKLGLAFFAWRLGTRAIHGLDAEWAYEQALYLTLYLWSSAHLGEAALWRYFKAAFLSGAALASAYAVAQSLGLDPFKAGRAEMGFALRGFGTLGNPNFLAGYLLLALPFAARDFLKEGKRFWLAGLIGLAILLSQTRAAWLAGALSLLFLVPSVKPLRLAMGLFLGLAAFAAMKPLQARLSVSDGGGRAMMARAAFEMALEHPVMGAGDFTGAYLMKQRGLLARPEHAAQPYRFTHDAHNDWLQLAAESGFMAALLFAALWALALWRNWKARPELAAALLAFGVHAGFHFPLAIVPSGALLWLLLGAALAQKRAGDADFRGLLKAFLAGLALAALAVFGRAWASSFLLNRGMVLSLYGNFESADIHLRAAGALRPGDERIPMRLGQNLDLENRPAEAMEQFWKVLELLPGHADARANYAMALGKLGRMEEAREQCLLALEGNPRSLEALGNLGKIEYMKGDKAAAVAAFQKGLALGRDWPQGHFNLAAIYFNEGKKVEALAQVGALLKLDPQNKDGLALLARIRGK